SYEALLRPTPLLEYLTRDFTMSTSSLQAEKTVYTSLTLFSDTKVMIFGCLVSFDWQEHGKKNDLSRVKVTLTSTGEYLIFLFNGDDEIGLV
nr:hypothetical protein [Tanacetum cinerariifolium]